jgi:hypothetical protein
MMTFEDSESMLMNGSVDTSSEYVSVLAQDGVWLTEKGIENGC